MVTIDFEMEKDGYVFCDALVLPEQHGLSQEQINAIKQQRFDAWLSIVAAESQE